MKKDDIIKWTPVEADRVILGKVVSVNSERVKFITDTGPMDVPLTDGKFEVVDEPYEPPAKPAPPKPRPRKKVVKPPPASGSKAARAMAVYKRMHGKTRKEVMQVFIDEVGLTKAGANTYYANCKKASS